MRFERYRAIKREFSHFSPQKRKNEKGAVPLLNIIVGKIISAIVSLSASLVSVPIEQSVKNKPQPALLKAPICALLAPSMTGEAFVHEEV